MSFDPYTCINTYCQDGVYRKTGQKWTLFGQELCYSAFLKLSTFTHFSVKKQLTSIYAGATKPTSDARTEAKAREKPKEEHCNMFFLWLWERVAEPLAEGESAEAVDAEEEEQGLAQDEFSKWVLQSKDEFDPLSSVPQNHEGRETRYLNQIGLCELYDTYKHRNKLTGFSSAGTFYSSYRHNWSSVLKRRAINQHARLATLMQNLYF